MPKDLCRKVAGLPNRVVVLLDRHPEKEEGDALSFQQFS
jgi:hypothetical protein